MPWLPGQRPTVGLDIGSTFLRALALRRSRQGWTLVAAGEVPLTDRGPDLRHAIEHLLDDLKVSRASVAVAVPARAAIVRRFTFPAASLADLERRVDLEVDEHLPSGRHDASVSYQLLDRGTDELAVVLGAARRNEVAERLAALPRRGRKAGVADVEGIALANALNLNYPDLSDSALVAHVGRRSTVVCLIERGELISTRAIDAGADVSALDLAAAIRHFLAPGKVARAFLSGGGWKLDGLQDRLAAELTAMVDLFDPLRRVHVSRNSRNAEIVGPPFALAVGLALRRRGDR